MISTIEAAFGSRVVPVEGTPLYRANLRAQKIKIAGQLPLMDVLSGDLDRAIQVLNVTPIANADTTPYFHRVSATLWESFVSLPMLEHIRETDHPATREVVDQVFNQANEDSNKPGTTFGWLGNLTSTRTLLSSFILEAYVSVLNSLPSAQETLFGASNLTSKEVVLALEEVLASRYPHSFLNRGTSVWHRSEEGFSQDFLEYSKARKLVEAGFAVTNLDLINREKVGDALTFVGNQPQLFLELVRSLDTAIEDLNQTSASGKIEQSMVNLVQVAPTVKDRPLPGVFYRPVDRYLSAIVRTFQRANQMMKAGESAPTKEELPVEVLESGEWFRFHVDAKNPETALAGFLLDGTGLWTQSLPEYSHIKSEVWTSALCEVLGRYQRNSRLFELLYNPENGPTWYDPSWGLSQEFVDSLKV